MVRLAYFRTMHSNYGTGDDLTVYFNRESAAERAEKMRRMQPLLIGTSLLVGAFIVAVALFVMEPRSLLLAIIGGAYGLASAVVMPRILSGLAKKTADIPIAPDTSLLVVTPHGVRRTTGDGPPLEIPYAEAELRRQTGEGNDRLRVSLPGENLSLDPALLHPSLTEILRAYEQFSGDAER